MTDEPQDNDQTSPDEQAPEADAPTPAGESPPAEEAPAAAEEASPAEESPPAEAEPAAADEAAPAEEAPPAEESEPAPAPAAEKKPAEKKPAEQAPGADLEPIRLEPDRPLDAEERARLEAEEEERARLEAEATADGEEPVVARSATVTLDSDSLIQATGKRKSAIARVVVRSGGGEIKVNDRAIDEYFPRSYHQTVAQQALITAGYEGQLDVRVRVRGGGIGGQADAVRHGIARALCEIDPELRPELKKRGFLTRDARVKERKKAGLKKARKKPQFSKR